MKLSEKTTFLLLDVREADEHSEWRIKESVNFTLTNVVRDKTIPLLYAFKNKEDKLIVIYMNDERQGHKAAKIFFEKGYDNIYLLSGGGNGFLEEYPDLIEGTKVPVPLSVIKKELERRKQEEEDERKQRRAKRLRVKF